MLQSNFMRAAILLLMLCTIATAQAVEYITDVMLIGAPTESELNSLKNTYSTQGWKIINYDLNKGVPWGSGDGILLLYKSEESPDGCNHNYITDFYIQNRGAANTTNTLNYDGRTYNLVPYDGSSHFKEQKGDLNSGTGANTDAIHLYYTRQAFPDNRAVTYINLNDTKKGAIGKEGGDTGYDLNSGCSKLTDQAVYFHFYAHPAAEPDYFITDVMVLGAWSKDDIDGLKYIYEQEGWTVIDYDLNKGVPSSVAPWVYLIYKKAHINEATDGYITDLFLDGYMGIAIRHNGIRYDVAPFDGDQEFKSNSQFKGNLNAGISGYSGGENIYVFYTRHRFLTDGNAINNIFVDDNPNGAFMDLDLNKKSGYCDSRIASAEPIYMHVSTASTWKHFPPVSNLDGYESKDGGIHVWGWAYDPDEPTLSSTVRVEVYRSDETVYKTETVSTNVQRDDVNNAKSIIGKHGFDATVSIEKAGTYTMKIYACDLTGDNDVQMGQTKTVKVDGSKPQSSLDLVETTETGIRVKGWAYDPDESSESVPVRIEVKRINGSAYKTVNLTANIQNDDVNNAYGITGNHGFDTTVPIEDAGTYTASIFAGDLTDDGDAQVGSTATLTFIGNSPVSYLDAFVAQEKGFQMQGWAYDPDSPAESVPIRVEVICADGTTYKTETVSANILRTDVNTAKGITGNHGFNATISVPKSGGYTIKIFACDLTKNADSQISSNQTLKVVGSKPKSSLDVCGSSDGGIRIKGWAYDPDEPGEKIPIRVEIKHADGSEYLKVNLTTDDVRDDVNSTNGIAGSHGFSAFIPVAAGTYKVSVFACDLTDDGDVQVGSTTTLTCTGFIVLTEESGEVTLVDGNVVTGTGGEYTRIVIADGATVTLRDINITSPYSTGKKVYEDDATWVTNEEHPWSGITCLGNATIILADGANNFVQGGGTRYSGIQPGPPGTTLTIRGNGTLEARGWTDGAGIGTTSAEDCGNIVIEGGVIKAYSFSAHYIMHQGAPYRVTATGRGAAIGTGPMGMCGDISITGGTVYAVSFHDAAAIGGGSGSRCGNITIGNRGVRIEATVVVDNSSRNTVGSGPDYYTITSACGTLTIGDVQTDYITESPWIYAPVDNSLTYTISFIANGSSGSMNNQDFVYNVPQALNACTFTRTGYHFTGWNTKADGSGISYTDGQEIYNMTSPSEIATLYAQWEPDNYSITYVNAVNGTDNIVNTNPTSYTYITSTINLVPPTYFGYEFVGWTWEGQTTPTKSATIPQGSTGNKTFTAHWTRATTLELTLDISGYTMVDGQSITGSGGANTHITIADGATVTLNGVNITTITDDSNHRWAGITCLGSATIILADGTTNYVMGACYNPGIFIGNGHTLTIKGNGTLNATGDSYAVAPGIGGNSTTPNGNIVIEGGTIIATGAGYAPGIGNISKSCGGDITIKGGTITAVGVFYAAGIGSGHNSNCGNITITEGVTSVTASKGGWDSPASIGAGYGGTSGTINISSALTSVVSGITQSLFHQLTLADNADNTAAINAKNGRTCKTVTLSGRTLYKDGAWNTLCLPFAVSTTSGPLAGDGVTAMTLNTATSGLSGSTLTLNFDAAPATIPAGTPFIIKWENTGDTIINPVFEGVTINNATTANSQAFTGGSFTGSFSPVSFTANDKSVLFLGAENKLYYPSADMDINSCRAYFQLTTPSAVKEFKLNFDSEEDEADGISSIQNSNFKIQDDEGVIYDLAGRKVSSKFKIQNSKMPKGLYIKNGHKIMFK